MIEHVKTKIYKVKSTLKEGNVLELEARIGYIHDIQLNKRIILETDVPTVYNLNKSCIFRVGVNKQGYKCFPNEIKQHLKLSREKILLLEGEIYDTLK